MVYLEAAMILNCLKYFRINTYTSVILKYLWVVHLPHLSGASGSLVELIPKLALRVSQTITDLYYRPSELM